MKEYQHTDEQISSPKPQFDTVVKQFLSQVSHGIRTPLNSIMGFSKLLLSKVKDPADQERYARRVVESSTSLLRFVERLVDLTQIEAGNMHYNETNCQVNNLLWDLTRDFEDTIADYQDIQVQPILVWNSEYKDLEIMTDPVILRKVLDILVFDFASFVGVGIMEIGYTIEVEQERIGFFIRKPHHAPSNKDERYKGFSFSEENPLAFRVVTELISLLDGHFAVPEDFRDGFTFELPLSLPQTHKILEYIK